MTIKNTIITFDSNSGCDGFFRQNKMLGAL